MAKRDRHYLGDGVAIQRRGEVWWLDVYRHGKRLRASLATRDREAAVLMGGSVLSSLQKREQQVHLLAECIPALRRLMMPKPEPEAKPHEFDAEFVRMLRDFADRYPQLRDSVEKVLRPTCPIRSMHPVHRVDPLPERTIKAYEDLLIGRLRDIALDGLHVENAVRRVVREELTPPSREAVPWESALEKFANSMTGKVHPDTLGNYLRDVREFFQFAKVTNVGDATSAIIDEWVSDLLQRKDPKTAKNKRGSISVFFRWAVRTAKIVDKNPVIDTDPPKVDPPNPKFLTRDQAAQRMERIKGQKWEWVPGISLYLGPRLGEIEQLNPEEDIDIPGRIIRVLDTKRNRYKNLVILDQALPYVLMIPKEGFRWSKDHISTVTNAMGVGNNVMRRSLETHLRLSGVLPQAVGDFWLGHDARTGARHYAGWWKPSEPPMKLTYFGLPLVPHGIPEVTEEQRKAFKS